MHILIKNNYFNLLLIFRPKNYYTNDLNTKHFIFEQNVNFTKECFLTNLQLFSKKYLKFLFKKNIFKKKKYFLLQYFFKLENDFFFKTVIFDITLTKWFEELNYLYFYLYKNINNLSLREFYLYFYLYKNINNLSLLTLISFFLNFFLNSENLLFYPYKFILYPYILNFKTKQFTILSIKKSNLVFKLNTFNLNTKIQLTKAYNNFIITDIYTIMVQLQIFMHYINNFFKNYLF